jgi:MFS family permease
VPALAAGAALVGATVPPIGPTIRKLWPRLVRNEEQRRAAFAFEATIQEVIFVMGPLLVGLITALLGWGAGIAAAGVMTFAGVLGFVLTDAVRSVPAPDPAGHADRHLLAALAPSGVRRVVAFSVGFGVAFGAVEVAMPAFAETHGGRALGSVALAAWSGGSLLGGLLAAGYAGREPHRRLRVTSAAFAAVLVLPLLAGSIETMAAAMLLAGLPIAPSFAITYGLVEEAAIPGTQAEVFGWLSMAVVAGFAAGTAAGGFLITHSGTDASICLGIAGAALASAMAWRPVRG